MKDLECPYCGHQQDICHDDGFGYSEDARHEVQCENCEKEFVFTTYVSYSYTAHKADCLNTGNHKLRLSATFPKEFSKMICCDCDYERELTSEERKHYNIGTLEDYFKKLDSL